MHGQSTLGDKREKSKPEACDGEAMPFVSPDGNDQFPLCVRRETSADHPLPKTSPNVPFNTWNESR